MTAVENISSRVHEISRTPVSDEALVWAGRCLIDSTACAVAGSRSHVAALAVEGAQSARRIEQASIFGFGRLASVDDAVLVNASSIRALDFNDTYAGRNNLHPSEVVIPITLALAELQGWTGSELLDAVARGYEVSIRLAEAFPPLLPRGWAPNATIGQLVAPALTAQLMGLSESQTAHAIAINTMHNATLAAVFKDGVSMAKNMATGFVVQSGVQAARLAGLGITGPLHVIEGTAGLVEMVTDGFDGDALTSGFDEPAITHVWMKRYPTMFHFQPAIEAGLRVSGDSRYRSDDIERITVRVVDAVRRTAATPAHWQVSGREDAQFSLPYSVCSTLVHGRCEVSQFREDAIKDERVANLLAKLDVEADDSLDAGGHPQPAALQVTLRDGTVLRAEVHYPKGHPENPLTQEELSDKFEQLVPPVLGAAKAGALRSQLEDLPDAADLSELFRLLSKEAA